MGKVKAAELSTSTLISYANILETVVNQLMNDGAAVMNNQEAGGINMEDSIKVTTIMQGHINNYSEKLNAVDEELGKRLKKDLSLHKTPREIGVMMKNFLQNYPVLREDIASLKAKQVENKVTDTKKVAKEGLEKMSKNGKSKVVVMPKTKK